MLQRIKFLLVFLIFAGLVSPICFAADIVNASNAINEAELKLISSFEAVAEAKEAGADIESLLPQLMIAGDSLSKAHLAFRAGDYETVLLLTLECNNAVEGLIVEADYLMTNADRIKTDTLLFTAFWSVLGLTLLLFFSFVIWQILKERFVKTVRNET